MKTTISATAEAQAVRLRAKAKDLPRRDWYRFANVDGSEPGDPVVYIYAEIGDSCWGDSVSASSFVQEFAAIDADRIQLHVNSPGGDVWEGIAIANSIRAHRAHVVATVDAIAASAASFIVCAADEVVMARNSELMIHDAMCLCVGNAADMREMADRADVVSNNIASMYVDKAGGTVQEWRDFMVAETWYSAEEAVAAGLADRVDTGGKAASDEAKNAFDLSPFAHAGRAAALAPKTRAHKPPATPAEPTTTSPEGADVAPKPSDRFLSSVRERLGVNADTDEDGILLALDETLAEQAETPVDEPVTPAVPDGFTIVDSARLESLEARASRGDQAYTAQLRAERERLIDSALADGRITRASAQKVREMLENDDAQNVTVGHDFLASLTPGAAVPMASVGYTGGREPSTDDDVDIKSTDTYKKWSM